MAASWTGEGVADFLRRLVAIVGRPAAIIKDGGSELRKAVALLEPHFAPSTIIDDISHVVANLFKHEYGSHPLFERFVTACGKAGKDLKQTILACLAPPKASTQARFMNLHRLVDWADKILTHSPRGRAKDGSLLLRLRQAIGVLPECRPFIISFKRDADAMLACQKVLKTKGLSVDTWHECQHLINDIPQASLVRDGFVAWGERHLRIAERFGMSSLRCEPRGGQNTGTLRPTDATRSCRGGARNSCGGESSV